MSAGSSLWRHRQSAPAPPSLPSSSRFGSLLLGCMSVHFLLSEPCTGGKPHGNHDQCMISKVTRALSATWSEYDQPRDQCMISQVISALSATWSVHDSHVISAWSVTWLMHDEPRDQCMNPFKKELLQCSSATWTCLVTESKFSQTVLSQRWICNP